MIHINNKDDLSYNKLKVIARLVEEEVKYNPYREVIVFTDEVEMTRYNLKYLFNLAGTYVNLKVLSLTDDKRYERIILNNTIIVESVRLVDIYSITSIDKTSYLIHDKANNYIEVKTKTFEPAVEGMIS